MYGLKSLEKFRKTGHFLEITLLSYRKNKKQIWFVDLNHQFEISKQVAEQHPSILLQIYV